MAALFTVPIASTGGSIVCTNPTAEGKEKQNVYLLTFISPKDNRLTPSFIDAMILALDIIEHRYPKGVVITTSGITKFYSNGLDLRVDLPRNLSIRLTRYLSFPMPTVCLLNGHAFAGGFMLAMYHDYRVQNPEKGFLCINELEFGVPLQTPMMSIFREKLVPTTFRNVVLEARRFGGKDSLQAGIVDALGGLDETLALIRDRKILNKADTGIYGVMKEEMYSRVLNGIDDHVGNLEWRKRVEEKKGQLQEKSLRAVEEWEKKGKAKL
ncbi:hypothetical protein N7450_007455 [Penicillium hetheringtonii]|uniref:Enoyl-CoA hydratase/isomerase family protein n=1 Tax=Penicillium hetheringtonii TaxID=911720 RepID=A0AAD6GQL3_9EURO|nr:hypothetical protein N7450_007455 [Penicillium hetheringtonii]